MSFIKDFLAKESSELTHKFFTRFGKGLFKKEVCNIRKSPKEIHFDGGYEYANQITNFILDKVKGNLKVTGKYVTLNNSESKFAKYSELELTKHDASYKKVEYKGEMTAERFVDFVNEFIHDGIFLVDVEGNGVKLKMKKAVPKPNKAVDKTAKFAVIKLAKEFEKAFHEEFLPDFDKEFKKATLQNIYDIQSIDIPKEFAKDFENARLHAKRVGKLKRILNIDGEEFETEIEFAA